jgi:GTP-binding protein HflX
MRHNLLKTRIETEKALLVGVDSKSAADGWSIDSSLEELAHLAKTAGAEVLGRLVQKMQRPSSTYYLGKGRLEELIKARESCPYSVVIFNDELKPRQQRNLEESLNIEESLNVKVIDRTALILDIFARRAQTREGQLQVELAQHQYLLPRLAGQWSHLERLGGGIGTRGPGESQLETDRRLIRKRIQRLQGQIESVRRHRALYRQKRKQSRISVVALVGYTNAGKSTLLNALSQANVLVEDKLFSTLDPVTRRLTLHDGKQVLLTDTVGFIHKLPPSIVAAFRATLEELTEADLLLHVVDITHNDASVQFETVKEILTDLGLADKPQLTVLNKMDRVAGNQEEMNKLAMTKAVKPLDESTLAISALKGWGLDKLLDMIDTYLHGNSKTG